MFSEQIFTILVHAITQQSQQTKVFGNTELLKEIWDYFLFIGLPQGPEWVTIAQRVILNILYPNTVLDGDIKRYMPNVWNKKAHST